MRSVNCSRALARANAAIIVSMPRQIVVLTTLFVIAPMVVGCRPAAAPGAGQVVVYTSLDQPYAAPVLQAFERQSGVRVAAVYDTEATKSLGLANRIAAERGRPRADVFWSSEVVRVIGLKAQGVLEPYHPPNAASIPERFKDAEGYWTGFAARARVIVYNTKLVTNPPRSRFDLEKPAWRNAVAMANPLFGTTATEAAALFELLGPERARAHYRALKANGVRIVDGNSVAADRTSQGEVRAALTDTDDALTRLRGGAPLGIVYPDQPPLRERGSEGARERGSNASGARTPTPPSSLSSLPRPLPHSLTPSLPRPLGTLVIPNTVALVKGGPHPEHGRRLVDYLLSDEVEALLAKGGARQLPLRPGVPTPAGVPRLGELGAFDIDFARVAGRSEEVDTFLKGLFQR
jgi:iron(III) transport system substrate-binding protein